jgi:DNA polymerase I-like protein with 3'-5' exonuclease and polymerase domains
MGRESDHEEGWMRVVACDTETVRGKPWSIQCADDSTPHGALFFCVYDNAMAVVKDYLEDNNTLTVLHNAKFDLRVLAECGIHPAHCECTMQMAYLLGEPRLSLKVLAYRLAGIEMRTYAEVTAEATQAKARAYLEQAAELDWEDPEPIINTARDGSTKLSFPKNIKGKVQRLLDKHTTDPSVDLYAKWGAMDEAGGRGQVEATLGKMEQAGLDEVDPQVAEEYAKLDAEATFAIYPCLHTKIQEYGLQGVLKRDMDCIPMIIQMEDNGILLDVGELESLKHDLDILTESTQADINYLAGHYVNPRSSQQVVALLQDEGIYTDMETSTDASVLDQYREHTIVNKIQDYRAYTKLQSTYVEGLIRSVGKDGRTHTTYSTTRTETGRLASSKINLQNIPVRTELGRRIRKAFISERSR